MNPIRPRKSDPLKITIKDLRQIFVDCSWILAKGEPSDEEWRRFKGIAEYVIKSAELTVKKGKKHRNAKRV